MFEIDFDVYVVLLMFLCVCYVLYVCVSVL